MSRRQLIVVDVETTGLDTERHWPIEIAAVNVDTGDELYLVPQTFRDNVFGDANAEALAINRYFERRVFAHKVSVKESEDRWHRLWEMLANNTLGGSNPAFDAAMLMRGFRSVIGSTFFSQPPWHHRLADLAAYAAAALHLRPHELVGLADVCKALNVENAAPHTALGDARATAECFRRLIDRYTARSVTPSASDNICGSLANLGGDS